MNLDDALSAIANDARQHRADGSDGFVDVCAKAKTAIVTEVPVTGGLVRVTYVPAGAADPVKTADETIAKLTAAAGKKPKGSE